MTEEEFSAAHYALKAAVRRSTKEAGGQEAACGLTRLKSHTTIGGYGRAQNPEHCPIDVAVILDREAGAPHILRAMAEALRCVVIELPCAKASPEWYRRLAEITTQTGQALDAFGRGLVDDGQIDAAEIRGLGLRDKLHDVMAACMAADAVLAEIEGSPLRVVEGRQRETVA